MAGTLLVRLEFSSDRVSRACVWLSHHRLLQMSAQTFRQLQRYERPSPVSRVVERLVLTSLHWTFSRLSLSSPAYIRSFTGSGCLVVFQRIGEMGSSSHFKKAKVPKLTAPATNRYRYSLSLERSSHMCCLKSLLHVHRRLQQSGFTTGRSTRDRHVV